MPSDGNSSPSFQCVRPLILPADSFCHILRPMADFCTWFSLSGEVVGLVESLATECPLCRFSGEQAHKIKKLNKAIRVG